MILPILGLAASISSRCEVGAKALVAGLEGVPAVTGQPSFTSGCAEWVVAAAFSGAALFCDDAAAKAPVTPAPPALAGPAPAGPAPAAPDPAALAAEKAARVERRVGSPPFGVSAAPGLAGPLTARGCPLGA